MKVLHDQNNYIPFRTVFRFTYIYIPIPSISFVLAF